MAVPKKKKSPSARNMRRAQHDRVTAPSISACPNCGDFTQPHHACLSCGTYNGRKVVDVVEN